MQGPIQIKKLMETSFLIKFRLSAKFLQICIIFLIRSKCHPSCHIPWKYLKNSESFAGLTIQNDKYNYKVLVNKGDCLYNQVEFDRAK